MSTNDERKERVNDYGSHFYPVGEDIRPRVSVCMATFNGELYLGSQLKSILECLDETDELIVSDDGSTDGTLAVLRHYAERYPIMRITHGPQKGPVANFSHVLSLAAGRYIFLSDQDDVWKPDKVSSVLTLLDNMPVDLIVHNAELVDGNGQLLGMTTFQLRSSHRGLAKNLIRNSYIGCCMAFRRELLEIALPIPDDIEMHDWWIGLIGETRFSPYFLNQSLIYYRRHGANVSSLQHYKLYKMLRNRAMLLVRLFLRLRESKIS